MIRLAISSIVILAACGDGGDGLGGRPGEFGRVEAAPECGALSQACIGQGLNAPIAKGSTLDIAVEYKVAGSSGPPTLLASANQAVITTPTPTQISAIAEGMSAVMFVGPAARSSTSSTCSSRSPPSCGSTATTRQAICWAASNRRRS